MPINEERATRARTALLAHYNNIFTEIIDLITDLMHLCEAEAIDFDECLRLANLHFDAETGGEA